MEELSARRMAYMDENIPRPKFILPFEMHYREAAYALSERMKEKVIYDF